MIENICVAQRAGQARGIAMAALVIAIALASSASAAAPGISDWVKGDHAATRLIVAGPSATDAAARDAALEIRLDPGYLTYWRQPGDAGLPPTFDTAASLNVGPVAVAYPAPHLFDEAGAQLFGYATAVTFPMRVTVVDPARPATLAVALDYAVCAALCLPGRARLHLVLPEGPAPEAAALLATARATVPVRAAPGAATTPAVLAATPDGAGGWRIVARAAAPATVFTEAPDGWFFAAVPGTPEPDGTQSFALTPVQRPAAAAGPLPLVLTLVAADGAVEVPVRVDAGPSKP